MEESYKKFNMFWTFDNPGAFKFMVCKTVRDALLQKGCESVRLTLFGPTTKLVAEQEQVRNGLLELMRDGVSVVACADSVARYKVREQIESIGGIEIKKLAKRAADDSPPDEKIVLL